MVLKQTLAYCGVLFISIRNFYGLQECSFYATDPDGTEYFYCGGTRIKISERFTSQGKEMEHLVEDAIQFAARLA